MSLYDYRKSQEIATNNYPFYALIMAAIRQADTDNFRELENAWPEIYQEFRDRCNMPGGMYPSERPQIATLDQTQG